MNPYRAGDKIKDYCRSPDKRPWMLECDKSNRIKKRWTEHFWGCFNKFEVWLHNDGEGATEA